VKRFARTFFHLLLRQMLVLGLVFTPLAQPMSLAAPLSQGQATTTMAGCHHARQQPAESGGCCWNKGHACHCAMAAALPVAASLTDLQLATFSRPTSFRSMIVAALSPPEPPPPRT